MPTFANKREVRDHVKQTLQLFVEDSTIETDELKSLIRTSSDAIDVPVSDTDVAQRALQDMISLLKERQADAETIARVSTHVQQVAPSTGSSAVDEVKSIGSTESSTATAAAAAEKEKSSFSLGGLRARMNKKREELKTARVEATAATTSHTASTSPFLQPSQPPQQQQQHVPTPAVSAGASVPPSPALAPNPTPTSPAPEAAPAEELLPFSTAVDTLEAPAAVVNTDAKDTEEPPTKAMKHEGLVLSAAPLPPEDDIYASLVSSRPRGRGRGHGGGRGRGAGHYPSPYAPAYPGAPLRGGGYPPRGGYYYAGAAPLPPQHPPYQASYEGRGRYPQYAGYRGSGGRYLNQLPPPPPPPQDYYPRP